MEASDVLERNRRFVIDHFDAFVNKRDVAAIDHNMASTFVDHDGPGGKPTDRDGDRAMMAAMYKRGCARGSCISGRPPTSPSNGPPHHGKRLAHGAETRLEPRENQMKDDRIGT
jgi:hypothetical protein